MTIVKKELLILQHVVEPLIKKAKKEKWSRNVGRAFLAEEIWDVDSVYVYFKEPARLKIKLKDLNLPELETVEEYLMEVDTIENTEEPDEDDEIWDVEDTKTLTPSPTPPKTISPAPGAHLGNFKYIGTEKGGDVYEIESTSHPGKFYKTRRNITKEAIKKWGEYSCNCPAWVFHKNHASKRCVHTEELRKILEGGFRVLAKYLSTKGSSSKLSSKGITNIIGLGILGTIIFSVLAIVGFSQKK